MEKGNQSSPRFVHAFKFVLLVGLISLVNPAHALTPEAAAHYQSFLDIYRSSNPTPSELQAALQSLEQANQAEQNVYKIVFSLGAINSTLKNWEEAVSWLQAAKDLATTAEQVESIDVELNYCQVQLARRKVANWGPDPVKVSFIMKQGTVEMSEDTLSKLPQVLPSVSVQESPDELIQTLRQRLDNTQESIATENGFVIVTMEDDFSPEQHYQRGISSFYQYFKAQYFTETPERWVVVILSARPWHLVNATEYLYPTVDLPEYAPFLGYYNPTDNLIMATGGRAGYGTLLHELMHALIMADFPDAPAWLNEGMSSLYERTKWQDNKLVTLPNWRMDRMQESGVSTLQQLSDEADGLGLHSPAIADFRLLFLFLDQKGLMSDFYARVKAGMPDVSISQILDSYAITETDWRRFLQETFASYRAEIARQRGALSHPDEIKYVQQALKATVNPDLAVDGDWGANTDKALTDFQRQHGLEPDGIMGPKTAAKLKAVYERKRVSSLPDS